jgi:hypothetical protein
LCDSLAGEVSGIGIDSIVSNTKKWVGRGEIKENLFIIPIFTYMAERFRGRQFSSRLSHNFDVEVKKVVSGFQDGELKKTTDALDGMLGILEQEDSVFAKLECEILTEMRRMIRYDIAARNLMKDLRQKWSNSPDFLKELSRHEKKIDDHRNRFRKILMNFRAGFGQRKKRTEQTANRAKALVGSLN